jgi:hypothetical protein
VRLDSEIVQAGAGGAGGRGTFGSAATSGSPGANDGSVIMFNPHQSSAGLSGGLAGVSGNGAGGPSIAIAHQGGAPILTQTNTKVGSGGAGVEARSQGGKTIPASPTGASEGVKSF